MANYAVFRSDLMSGTTVGADLVSVKYMGSGTTETAIENGNIVKLDGLMTGEREVYKGVTPAANSALDEIVIIGSVEVPYDERKRSLTDFINEAGSICRGWIPRSRNKFSVTREALDGSGEPAVGNIVELQAGTKMKFVASATASTTTVGKIIAVEPVGTLTYYVIEIA